MTLDQDDLNAIAAAILQVPAGKIANDETGAVKGPAGSFYSLERATVTGLFEQTTSRVGAVGFIGVAGSYAGMQILTLTGATRIRTIGQHTIQASGAGDIHVLTLQIPLGAPLDPNEIIQLC